MKSTRSIGNYYEARSKKYLEKMGYSVEKFYARLAFFGGKPHAMHHDGWGCIDQIGIKRDSVVFAQVKFLGPDSHGSLAETRRKLAALPAPAGSVWLHVWRPNAHKPEVEMI